MEHKRIIAVDLDGTILREKKPVKSVTDFGQPEKKVRECLKFLQRHGFEILIHTCRTSPELSDQPPVWLWMNVEEALKEREIPFDRIYNGLGKPLAEFYIDDRGVFYAGDWEKTMREILARAERSYKNVY